MTTVRDFLEQAIGTGEIVGIIYHGGSQPGCFRDIVPIHIANGIVRARCYASNDVKTFALEKIELRGPVPTPEDIINSWQQAFVPSVQHSSVADVIVAHRAHLESLGWTVICESAEYGDDISLCRTFKNGKLIKTPVVRLIYSQLSWGAVAEEDGTVSMQNFGPRQRPWTVYSTTLPAARSYADAKKAVDLFLASAEALAPNRPRK